jgi:hypothetical protein
MKQSGVFPATNNTRDMISLHRLPGLCIGRALQVRKVSRRVIREMGINGLLEYWRARFVQLDTTCESLFLDVHSGISIRCAKRLRGQVPK